MSTGWGKHLAAEPARLCTADAVDYKGDCCLGPSDLLIAVHVVIVEPFIGAAGLDQLRVLGGTSCIDVASRTEVPFIGER